MKWFLLVIVGLMFGVSRLFLDQLPPMIPMHWNIVGEVDNWMPKNQAVWFFPLMTLGMLILFQVLPKLDPKRENYKLFAREWDSMQLLLIGFFAYIQGATFYISLHPEVSMLRPLFFGLGILFVFLGNILSKIRQNYFIGIKVPWTLSSTENWNKTHRFASWCFVIAGFLTLSESVFHWLAPQVIFVVTMVAAFLPIGFSYWMYRFRS